MDRSDLGDRPGPPSSGTAHPGPFAAADPHTADLFAEYRRTGARAVRNRLIELHIPLAESLARRYANRGEPFDDLRQVALVGLLKAVERFEPSRGTPFGAYAIPTVRGELRRHFRDLGWAVKVPRRMQEMHLHLDTVASRLAHELGRPPTLAEIAADIDTSEESVLEALEIGDLYRLQSLDTPPRTPGVGGSAADRTGAPDPDLERAETRIALDSMLAELPERDRRVLFLRYFEDMTQSEIADAIGVSQMHVSRLITRSLSKLRAENTRDVSRGSVRGTSPSPRDESRIP